MLLPVPLSRLTVEHIRQFCIAFPEGLRVEYKQELSESVRGKLPAIVSAFANSYGGILIIGVKTERGAALSPVIGYLKPREELRLTVENICLQNLNPSLVPRIQEIASDEPGRAFLVVEVDESIHAPHAIENSRKIYVRTGDGNTPQDLADVRAIERLLERRKQVSAEWDRFVSEAEAFLEPQFGRPGPKLKILIGPTYPAMDLVEREQLFHFISHSRKYPTMYRHPLGSFGLSMGTGDKRSVVQANCKGQFLFWQELQSNKLGVMGSGGAEAVNVVAFAWIARALHRVLALCKDFFEVFAYRGSLKCDVLLNEVQGIPFTVHTDFSDSLTSIANEIPAKVVAQAELLGQSQTALISNLMHQLIWPFVTAGDRLENGTVESFVEKWLNQN